MQRLAPALLPLLLASASAALAQNQPPAVDIDHTVHFAEETHFKNVRQLTFGGNNAEAYWSFDDKQLVMQSDFAGWGVKCDQIFLVDVAKGAPADQRPPLLSTGKGRTTCSYFLPGNKTFVYASTHLGDDNCPPVPPRRTDGKYVWPIFDTYDIFTADLSGKILSRLTSTPGYDAEATVSPKGDRMVFTSMRSGDLELYTCKLDGSDVKQVTNTLGYDGGAFFSPDGKMLVWRASRPTTPEEVAEYKQLLAEGLVQPTSMEIFVANADGSNARQVTHLGKANWAPFFHPSGKKIIFSSNHATKRGFPFSLYLINLDGTGLERVTYSGTFDAFAVFSNDGKYLAFSSNRNNGGGRDTNVFIAEWQD